ncbi:FAD-dependent oxidoreductase [Microbacterium sp. NPDC058342]|uniref:FAD-dependent oxidoreductase n=1 Tax=Microbacterium sp. NPDC058342 TaxID=3346454 RepID=UPI003646A793
MLTETPLAAQLAAQRDDRLRVLIVGAGIAGITLAQLLRRDGLHPVLVDRMPVMEHPGYMLALMPTVDQAFVDLGVHTEYRDAGTPMARYAFRSHRGRLLRTDSMSELLSVYGEYNGISRGALIEVLTAHGCPVTFGTTVDAVAEGTARFVRPDGAPASEAAFDLIIGADGIRSRMRDVLGAGAPDAVETGWSGWVAWAEDLGDPALGEELWGDGFFLGVYPVKDRLGVFLGGPDAALADGPAAFAGSVRNRVDELGPRLSAAVAAVAADPDPYLWRLDDARVPRWVLPHGVLLGDAAAGFLPTAGIGAGMAIESAWMLARMLRQADRAVLADVLEAWERAERPRVEAAQSNSRMLAKLMFRRGRLVAWLRETVMRMLSVRAALGPILKLVASRPDPDAIAREARNATFTAAPPAGHRADT